MARIKFYDPSTGVWTHADEILNIAPVQSVNGMTGAVSVTCENMGAEPANSVSAHNTSTESHADIRSSLAALISGKLDRTGIEVKTAVLTLDDGSTVTCDVLVMSDSVVLISYTNQIPISIDTDGSIYNGCGYEYNLRLSSSGETKSHGYSYVTGYIPAKGGDVIRIYGCGWGTTEHSSNYICAYDSSFTFIGGYVPKAPTYYGTTMVQSCTKQENGDADVTLSALDTIAYIRVNSRGLTSTTTDVSIDDMIVTVNEEIT